jgi:hypothetical protein
MTTRVAKSCQEARSRLDIFLYYIKFMLVKQLLLDLCSLFVCI